MYYMTPSILAAFTSYLYCRLHFACMGANSVHVGSSAGDPSATVRSGDSFQRENL